MLPSIDNRNTDAFPSVFSSSGQSLSLENQAPLIEQDEVIFSFYI